jgi:hypothetical protein
MPHPCWMSGGACACVGSGVLGFWGSGVLGFWGSGVLRDSRAQDPVGLTHESHHENRDGDGVHQHANDN